MEWIKLLLSKEYRKRSASRRKLHKAMKEADKLKAETGLKHYVVRLDDDWQILNNRMVKQMKKDKMLAKSIDYIKLEQMAMYVTK